MIVVAQAPGVAREKHLVVVAHPDPLDSVDPHQCLGPVVAAWFVDSVVGHQVLVVMVHQDFPLIGFLGYPLYVGVVDHPDVHRHLGLRLALVDHRDEDHPSVWVAFLQGMVVLVVQQVSSVLREEVLCYFFPFSKRRVSNFCCK